jgi:outer membrane receptor protein involved in Fe transport
VTAKDIGPWSWSAFMRYFGPHPLTEDNAQIGGSSLLWSGRATYKFDKDTNLNLDVLNLFDRRVNDIEYFYTSRLQNELVGQPDHHFHPAEPRTIRLSLVTRF